jgi:hypothetical protein
MQLRITVLCCACAAFWLPPAAAQQQASAHPANPRAAVPAPGYASAFTGYRPFRDEPLAPWREVNDEVARVGGHIGIFRAGTAAAPGATPTPAAAGNHAGHHPGTTK